MCGIVGYIGTKRAQDFVMDGLEKLEYRGYDSAGIAVNTGNGKFAVTKKEGRLQRLADELHTNPIEGTIGIGHTRWATHGKPSDTNSHPHFNKDKTIVALRQQLRKVLRENSAQKQEIALLNHELERAKIKPSK